MRIKLLSSLEKCFLDENIDNKNEIREILCLKNEELHLELAYQDKSEAFVRTECILCIEGELSGYISASRIENVPVRYPCNLDNCDDNYLRKESGLYPDILVPINKERRVYASSELQALWLDIKCENGLPSGRYQTIFKLKSPKSEEVFAETSVVIEVVAASLPKQDLIFTQWFYCDCLADYYGVESFSDRHFEIIENFAKVAVDNGVNMLLTPLFTPPLDTFEGGERTTTQLVGIARNNGAYSFDFSLLGRWIDMCDRVGIKYFEINHFFTQWGALHSPKIMATVDGENKRIFGWETDAYSEEYKFFLRTFIPELLSYLRSKNNADKRCYFHISDEPSESQLENYKKAKSMVGDLLCDYPIIDALSDYEFYERGIIKNPIPSNDRIEPFIENNVEPLWTYYCVSQAKDVSNRFISMPSARNRIIGMQFYKYNIKGFLHWGYNFYNDQFSRNRINPYLITDGDWFAPSGDTFSVYPSDSGTAYRSLRLSVFFDALQDDRRLKLLESLVGREKALDVLEKDIPHLTFKEYPKDSEWLIKKNNEINRIISEKL